MTTSAAMPSEEDVARIVCRRVHDALFPNSNDWRPGELEQKVDIYWPHYTREARAILALFAPILAEKEREIEASIESHDAWATIWNDKLEAAEARALAAEAALAGERERCAGIAERFKTSHFDACGSSGSFSVDKAEMAQALCARDIAAAIRAQGE